jgi:hypothetical protein
LSDQLSALASLIALMNQHQSNDELMRACLFSVQLQRFYAHSFVQLCDELLGQQL